MASAWLLATHDGTVLLLADDVKASSLIKRALLYRRALQEKLSKLSSEERAGVWTDIRAKRAIDGGVPLLVCITCRLRAGGRDGPIGCGILNPSLAAPIEFSGSASLAGKLAQPTQWRQFSSPSGGGSGIDVGADGLLRTPIMVPPKGGEFFLA